MQTFYNIETVRIALNSEQRTYYIPYKKNIQGRFLLGVSVNARTIDGSPAFPVGQRMAIYDETANTFVTAKAYITLLAQDGTTIAQDFDLSLCTTQRNEMSPLDIEKNVDWDNSYIRIPNNIPSEFLANKTLFLTLYYYGETQEYSTANKHLIVDFPRTPNKEIRLSDYIVGYQGKLLRIEVLTQEKLDGYITINDAGGRTFENVPLDNFYSIQYIKNEILGASDQEQTARIYKPLRFLPIVPDWQNCKIYTGVATPNIKLNFIFEV